VLPYLLSAGAGLLVGVVYSMLGVRSPAPPIIALVGLLGILAGEQIVPIAKRIMAGEPVTVSWLKRGCVPHLFGHLPGHASGHAAPPAKETMRDA
jgi:XapX domain-containing protein